MKWALLPLLLMGGAGAVPVWLPDLHRTAQLTPAGLHLSPGQPLSLTSGAENGVDLGEGRRARFAPSKTLTLEVLNAAGKVTARWVLDSQAGTARLTGTVRGPCVTSWYDGLTTLCSTPDLKAGWAQLGGEPLLVTRGGGAAIEPDPASRGYSDRIALIRTDLRTDTRKKLSVQAALTAGEAEYGRAMFDTYGAVNVVQALRELPGGRLLACVTNSMPKVTCRLDVLNADGTRVLTLDGHAAWRLPQVSKDGRLAYALGNTLQVWNLRTGGRVWAVSDPAWTKGGRSPLQAFLTPDGTRVVVVAGQSSGPPGVIPEVFVYALNSGRLTERFTVRSMRL